MVITMRVSAFLTLGLLVAYDIVRVVATSCSGLQCDIYIPLSLLVPLLILILAAVTGVLTISAARQRAHGTWLGPVRCWACSGRLGSWPCCGTVQPTCSCPSRRGWSCWCHSAP